MSGRLDFDHETEAGGEIWSPDGKNILFTSDVYPQCEWYDQRGEHACNAEKARKKPKYFQPLKALIFDRLLYRHWNAYKAGRRSHIFVVPVPVVEKVGGMDRIKSQIASHPPRSHLAATTTRLHSPSAARTIMLFRPTARRFATPRITTKSKLLRPTMICGLSR